MTESLFEDVRKGLSAVTDPERVADEIAARAALREIERVFLEFSFCLGLWENAVGAINTWPPRCRAAMNDARAVIRP